MPESSRGLRLDKAIADVTPGASIREIRRALEEGVILVNGQRAAPGERAQGGEAIELGSFLPRAQAAIVPDPDLLSLAPVLYEDEDLLALDKPSGVPTAPIRANEGGTLLHAAVAHDPRIAAAGPALEGGLLHRLDTGTSGVVLFAKRAAIRESLRRAFGEHRIEKRYEALVHGPIVDALLDGAIGPGPTSALVRVLAAGDPRGQPASTRVQVSLRIGDWALVVAETSTGRRHQVRAHLAAAGAPIAADPLYGGELGPIARLALHAAWLRLPSGLEISAPRPADFVAALEALRA